MPRYQITGVGKTTGRRRTRIYRADNEEAARRAAESDGTAVDGISEVPPDPPTEPQLAYAKHLGISIPPRATFLDVSALISIATDADKPTTERHRTFGKRYGLEFSEYIGKRELFDRIQAALVEPGRERDLVEWFTFRIYRHLVSGSATAPIEGPGHPIIQGIASRLAADERVVASIRWYSGRQLIWFGEWTSPDGVTRQGGSTRTVAYQMVNRLLRERTGLPDRTPDRKRQPKQRVGCTSRALAILILVLLCVLVVRLAEMVLRDG